MRLGGSSKKIIFRAELHAELRNRTNPAKIFYHAKRKYNFPTLPKEFPKCAMFFFTVFADL